MHTYSTAVQPEPIPTICLKMTQTDDEEIQKINSKFTIESADDSNRCSKTMRSNWPPISQPLTILLILLVLWGIAYPMLPELMHPSSPLMRMVFLFVGAQICGILVSFTGLPDLLGMLFWGVLYTNVGLGHFDGYGKLEALLRELALVNIMLLAGLGLDLAALKKLFGIIARLTLLPTVAEVGIITVISYLLLNMPWLWGLLLGLVVTAVSPNVVVTMLLKLKEERLGLNKGIHTLIIAMTSCNDVVAIFLFGVLLGVIYSTGNLTSTLLQGPIGVVIGLVFGSIMGYGVLYLPSPRAKYANGLKFTLIILSGTLSVVGSKAIAFPSAGALGCIMVAFVAGTGWRKQKENGEYENNEVAVYLDLLWKFLKPISFSLIGKEVNFSILDGTTVGYGVVALLCGVIGRLVVSYVSAYGADLTWKEKAYVTISGFPKATVQAAIGPIALDLARQLNRDDTYDYANTVLIISVLAIILTAPLGAVLMSKLAPKWLQKSQTSYG